MKWIDKMRFIKNSRNIKEILKGFKEENKLFSGKYRIKKSVIYK